MITNRCIVAASSPSGMIRRILKPTIRLRTKSTLDLGRTVDLGERNVRSKAMNPIPDFDDVRITFHSKSTKALLRAASCFQASKIPFIVENSERLLLILRNIFGERIVESFVKATFYGQFCAGNDQEQISQVIKGMKDSGVGSILDFAAENDEPIKRTSGISSSLGSSLLVHEYDHDIEARCEDHVTSFLHCINDVARNSTNKEDIGYAAIKITALGNPKLLTRLSTAIVEATNLFSIFDKNGDGFISRQEFELEHKRFFIDGDVCINELFQKLDPFETGFIDYISWSMMLSPQDLPNMIKTYQKLGSLAKACPTDEEVELLNTMYTRGSKLAKEAAKIGVRLLVDAEQLRYQPAIDHMVLGLQRQFNTGDIPIIYNTYQCYLRDSFERLRADIARSERFGYHFGAKLVRGAYMESERKLIGSVNIEDPIHPTIEETHKCYDTSVDYLLQHSIESELNVEIMCATHNQASILNAIESMNFCGIDRRASTVSFSQLYGMSDQLTFNLGKEGYRAYKYLPYGEVDEVMPYLLRRAKENSAIVGRASEEFSLIRTELKRRFNMTY